MASLQASLDSVLLQLGDFGRYQCFVLGLVSIAVILHSAVHVAFVFTAMDIEYRCEVPECDLENSTFQPDWLRNAVPFINDKPEKCQKFQHLNSSETEICARESFDRNSIEGCDTFKYKTEEITILHEYNLHCDHNLWKLTMIGTFNTIGQFVGLPASGVLSDRFGRRTILILGMVFCAIFGIARTFAPDYIWFSVLEFLDAAFGAGTYACGFILGVELVAPKKRVLTGTLICCCYAIGEILTAVVAWLVRSWKPLIYILYTPALLLISYFWLIPESVRWLLTQQRTDEARKILSKVAEVNKKVIPDNVFEKLALPMTGEDKEPFIKVFKSKILVLRFINACFCWITCAFLFYGLTLNSVALAGNSYVDFILTALVEIPAYCATYYTVDRFGRKLSQSVSFFLTAAACLAFIFIDDSQATLKLCMYLFGKFGATAAFTVCYVISSEIFPTPLRHSLMGVCSMFGRIGSMVSPQMPLLSALWTPLPLVLFTGMAAIAGLLTLLFPETVNIKLPDTIEEAENIGRSTEKLSRIII